MRVEPWDSYLSPTGREYGFGHFHCDGQAEDRNGGPAFPTRLKLCRQPRINIGSYTCSPLSQSCCPILLHKLALGRILGHSQIQSGWCPIGTSRGRRTNVRAIIRIKLLDTVALQDKHSGPISTTDHLALPSVDGDFLTARLPRGEGRFAAETGCPQSTTSA
jgi:hypothetical protein